VDATQPAAAAPDAAIQLAAVNLGLIAGLWLLAIASASAQERPCGTSRGDWCPAPMGDPCGGHENSADCRADQRCRAMRYRGPFIRTFVSCRIDARGFSANCGWLVVGCVSMRR
jgi:hypothetical protein